MKYLNKITATSPIISYSIEFSLYNRGVARIFFRGVSSQPVQEGFAAPLDHSCTLNYKSIKF